jgi:hypothetical protein
VAPLNAESVETHERLANFQQSRGRPSESDSGPVPMTGAQHTELLRHLRAETD